jgi:Domain of unknown function (DUF6457)
MPTQLTDWTDDLTNALGIDLASDADLVDLVLDLARDAAHSVDRPAAPLTTFLVGYAAARRGGGPDAIKECAALARQLALTWAPPARQDGAPS